jgi:hypothetical protein
MANEILANVTVSPQTNGTFLLDKHYQYELESHEPSEFKKNYVDTIAIIKKELDTLTSDKYQDAKKRELLKRLDTQYKQYQDALMNFKKYQSQVFKEFKQRAEDEKKKMFEFCQNFEEIKNGVVAEDDKKIAERIEKLKLQLQQNQELLKAYEGIDEI